ncbi:hypothetical protein ACN9M0_02190 [Streptomyces sp. R-07]|uniref:hypothetical protein n=1 Tax=Streptomyces sp. R-07 TaxID=3404052 RepID=UPI003CF928F0
MTDRVTDQAMAVMDEADVGEVPALEVLLRMQEIGRRLFEANPVLGVRAGSAEAAGLAATGGGTSPTAVLCLVVAMTTLIAAGLAVRSLAPVIRGGGSERR